MENKRFLLGMLVIVLALGMTVIGCDNGTGSGNGENNGGNGGSSGNDDPNLAKVLPLLRHTLYVKAEYDKGNKPSYITSSSGTVIASISYAANGALNEVQSNSTGLSTLFMSSQPLFISGYGRTEASANGITDLAYGTDEYDYTADPTKAVGLFSNAIAANCNFNTLDNLKRLSNNNAITQDLFNSIIYPSGGQYRLIIFGKNSSGTLIGKYVGYATTYQGSFTYWCIDPESSSFGSRATKALPNS
jgi:hypothetical protein